VYIAANSKTVNLDGRLINLHDIRYVRLGTSDLAAAKIYACSILGLELIRQDANQLYFRSDQRDHTLVYFLGKPEDQTVGFELSHAAELEQAAEQLDKANIEVNKLGADQLEQRRIDAGIQFTDPSGNQIDLVVRPQHSGRRYFPSRDAGITGFSHIGLCTTDPLRDEAFWTQVLGAKVSDRIGNAPLLRIDEVHHRIALFPSNHHGVQHINHQVESIDDLMRAWYKLKQLGVKIVFGPGRHPTSGAVFLYFEGPNGMIFEYSTGVRHITAQEEVNYVPRQFPRENASFCMWGSVPDIVEFKDVNS
jgi:2,3-dihydroxy-p-cumate/2,3-dihydroxybenzoate 3,4-dioxygenase